jgi:hypothetical protein
MHLCVETRIENIYSSHKNGAGASYQTLPFRFKANHCAPPQPHHAMQQSSREKGTAPLFDRGIIVM